MWSGETSLSLANQPSVHLSIWPSLVLPHRSSSEGQPRARCIRGEITERRAPVPALGARGSADAQAAACTEVSGRCEGDAPRRLCPHAGHYEDTHTWEWSHSDSQTQGSPVQAHLVSFRSPTSSAMGPVGTLDPHSVISTLQKFPLLPSHCLP